ncbi:MAG: MFS transporter, partial [Actinomycetota bacterium]|nr:MFS transporter [Actinomycetota bacterium]
GREVTFFSLYEVCSKGTAWIAPLLFTIVVDATGSFRQAILSLILLFVLGLVLLVRTDTDAAVREAENPRPMGV